jgi:hypothetical protein
MIYSKKKTPSFRILVPVLRNLKIRVSIIDSGFVSPGFHVPDSDSAPLRVLGTALFVGLEKKNSVKSFLKKNGTSTPCP